MAPPVSAMLLAQGQRQGNTQFRKHTHNTNTHTLNTLSHFWTMHAPCLPALLIHPYMFSAISRHDFTAIVDVVCVCVCVKVWESVKPGVCVCDWACVCALHAICRGALGRGSGCKVSHGVNWLLNPNVQVRMCISPTPPHPVYLVRVGMCVCVYVLMCICTHVEW